MGGASSAEGGAEGGVSRVEFTGGKYLCSDVVE